MANMLRISRHGGYCCGVKHIYGFDYLFNLDSERIKEEIQDAIQRVGRAGVYEVVLNNRQLKNNTLRQALQEKGFVLVSRFINPNSNAMCNVFHYYRGNAKRDLKNVRNWKGEKQ